MTAQKPASGQLSKATILALSLLFTTGAFAHENAHKTELFKPGVGFAGERAEPTASETGEVPLYAGLGDWTYPVTTQSERAQAYFDQGFKLAWAFNHAEAARAFRAAQRVDPACAMCFWGEAFVLGPNINDGMHAAAVTPAFEAISRAVSLAEGTTATEKSLIGALANRYSRNGDQRQALDQAWAEAMAAVAEQYQDDPAIQALYAEALMNLQPWDYWEADGVGPKGRTADIISALERALSLEPGHPAAAHLYIHAVEASATPERAERHADALRGAMPAAGHLVHMPAHIYARVGRFGDSLAVNADAIRADEQMLAAMGDAASPLYRFGYYPHNVHFLMVAAQLSGAREEALAAAVKLSGIVSQEVSGELGWVQAIETAPYTVHAQFSDPATLMTLPDPGDRFPFVKGYWHYARGTGFALSGRFEEAAGEVAALRAIQATADLDGLEAQYVPARTLLGIAMHVVEARIDQRRGDYEAAVHHLEAAIGLEAAIAYMEPPYWYYPVHQTLGAVQLQSGDAAQAVVSFQKALAQLPKNGWSLWGLHMAQAASGYGTAEETRRRFRAVWLGDNLGPDPERL
ncbi:MAG: hypothetical protein CL583_14555 [Alteromonadaceae bacterium]|nr:hypothetical protein [Alteromonadaceae bacterium]